MVNEQDSNITEAFQDGKKLLPQVVCELRKANHFPSGDLLVSATILGAFHNPIYGRKEFCAAEFSNHWGVLIERIPTATIHNYISLELLSLLPAPYYEKLRRIWELNLAAVLHNTSRFLCISDIEMTQKLCLISGSSTSSRREIESLSGIYGDLIREVPGKSINVLNQLVSISNSSKEYLPLNYVGFIAAFQSNDFDAASEFAARIDSCLSFVEGRLSDYELHIFHTTKGELSIVNNEFDIAEIELMKSISHTHSAVLRSFGPRLSLAAKLLRAGRGSVVKRYLEQCCEFVATRNKVKFEKWCKEIERGICPDLE